MGEYRRLGIKAWALEDRPREKMLQKGLASLTDAELLSILIGSGTEKASAVDLGKMILSDHNNSLHELGKSSVASLKSKYHGIGEARAITIVAALELGRRRKLSDALERPKITGSRDVFEVMHPLIGDLPHEEFWTLFLNRANKIIMPYKVSQGGVSGTVIDVRIIMKSAIENLASSIILAHNHPSGNLDPSDNDVQITRKMKDAGTLVDIPVLDHLIISSQGYYSFADEGLI